MHVLHRHSEFLEIPFHFVNANGLIFFFVVIAPLFLGEIDFVKLFAFLSLGHPAVPAERTEFSGPERSQTLFR